MAVLEAEHFGNEIQGLGVNQWVCTCACHVSTGMPRNWIVVSIVGHNIKAVQMPITATATPAEWHVTAMS